MESSSTPSLTSFNNPESGSNSSSFTGSSESRKRKSIQKRSWCWSYFLTSSGLPVCKICSEQVKTYNSSTTELIKHLEKHKIYENTNQSSLRPKKIRLDFCSDFDSDSSDDEETDENYSISKQSKFDNINRKLMAFILSNNLPFNIVESDEFQEFINSIKKNFYKLPTRQTVRNSYLFQMVFIKN